MSDTELLQTILSKVESLEKALLRQDERRVNVREFSKRLNISVPSLYSRINDGVIKKPFKDGKLSYWLNSYVNEVVVDNESSQ